MLLELVASRRADLPAGYEPLFTPVTNGLGAGPAAREHGLRELLQRDGNSVSYRALDRGVGVELDGLADPVALELLARYDAAGVDVRVKLAGISCGVASVYCVGRDRDLADAPHPLALAACGEAAQPRRELAVRKALLEFAAARSRRIFNHAPFAVLERVVPAGYLDRFRSAPLRSEEDRSLRATLDWAGLDAPATAARLQRIHAVRETVALSSLPDAAEVDLAAHGLEALWVPFGELAGKAFVPGLEVESLSYARVGPRNLARLVEAGVGFAGYGPPPPGAEPLVLPEGEPGGWLDLAAMDSAVGDLYGLYREPGRHVAAMAAA
jgi:ribosomal protein S12 methylthiotransferase accessory factor